MSALLLPTTRLSDYTNVNSLATDIAAKVKGQNEPGEFAIEAHFNGKTVKVQFGARVGIELRVKAYYYGESVDEAREIFSALHGQGLKFAPADGKVHSVDTDAIPRQTHVDGKPLRGSGRRRQPRRATGKK